MMITVIMTMMMILWKKLIFTDILILILICRWFCYAMYLPYAFAEGTVYMFGSKKQYTYSVRGW